MVNELYGAESKSQVYGAIHTLLHENTSHTSNLGEPKLKKKNIYIYIFKSLNIIQNFSSTMMVAISRNMHTIQRE